MIRIFILMRSNAGIKVFLLIILLLFFASCNVQDKKEGPDFLHWTALPSLPPASTLEKAVGLAGHFTGVHNDVLMVAGGTNFPDGKAPWNGGKKVWYNDIYVLEKKGREQSQWLTSTFKLPRHLAYGYAVSTSDGILCIGGADSLSYYKEVYLLRWNKQTRTVEVETMPSLPTPLAYFTAVQAGDKIFIAGGETSPRTHISSNTFYALDLSRKNEKENFRWEQLASWPGPGRIMPAMAVQSDGERNCIYLFSGRSINGSGEEALLSDGYRYNIATKEWKKIADVALRNEGPRCVSAAPAIAFGINHILVFGGADGPVHRRFREVNKAFAMAVNPAREDSLRKQLDDILANHPGFSKDILAYHTITDQWIKAGEIPGLTQVATQAVRWDDDFVIASGEVLPGVRSANVWRAEHVPQVSQALSWPDFVLIALYFVAVIFIVGRYRKKNKNTNDFYKAGGRIPGWASGVAIFGTLLSSITFLTTPAKTFSGDWMFFLPSLNTLIVAPLIVLAIIPVYRRLDITTAYEYLEKRFDKILRMLGSLSFLLFRSAKIGVILLLPSLAISAVTGMNVITCVTIVGIFSTVYCVVGGIEAVVWTEVLQVFVLLLGAILSLVVILFKLDSGVDQIITMADKANKLSLIRWDLDLNNLTFLVMIAYWIGGGLVPYTSDQAIIQKYLTTKDEKSAVRGVWMNAALVVFSSFLFFAIGTALFAFYNQYPQKLNPQLASSEAVFPWFIVNELPAGVRGLVTAGVFAAAMSSLNSSMNSMSAAVVTDYTQWKKNVSSKRALLLAKIFTAFFGLLGTAIALFMFVWEVGSLWDLIRKLTGLLTGGLAGLFILGIFTTRANARGALIGLLGSSLIQYYISSFTPLHFMLYSFTGIASCFVIGYLASFLFPSGTKPLLGLTVFTLGKREKGKRDATVKETPDNEPLIAT